MTRVEGDGCCVGGVIGGFEGSSCDDMIITSLFVVVGLCVGGFGCSCCVFSSLLVVVLVGMLFLFGLCASFCSSWGNIFSLLLLLVFLGGMLFLLCAFSLSLLFFGGMLFLCLVLAFICASLIFSFSLCAANIRACSSKSSEKKNVSSLFLFFF